MQQLIEQHVPELQKIIIELEGIEKQLKQNPSSSLLSELRKNRMAQLTNLANFIAELLPIPNTDTIKQEIEQKYSLSAANVGQAKVGRDYIKELSKLTAKLEKDIGKLERFKKIFEEQVRNCRQVAQVIPSQPNLKTLAEFLENLKTACEGQLDALQKVINQKITEVIPIKSNSLVVYFWVLRGTPNSLTRFGHNLKGHAAIAVNRPNPSTGQDEIAYLSFYPDKEFANESSTWQAKIADWVNKTATWLGQKIPPLRDKKGVFASYEHDLYRHIIVEDKYGYESCNRIEINCEGLSSVNLNEIYKFIDQIQKGKAKFNYYKKNCAAMCLDAMKEGGIGENWFHGNIIVTPAKLIKYAEWFNYKNEQEVLNKSLAKIETAKTRFIKRLEYIKQRLENDVRALQNNGGNKQEKESYTKLLDKIDDYLNRIRTCEEQKFNDTVKEIEEDISQTDFLQNLPENQMKLLKILEPLLPLKSNSYVLTSLKAIETSFVNEDKNDNNIKEFIDKLKNISTVFESDFHKNPRAAFFELSIQLSQLAQTLRETYGSKEPFGGTITQLQTILGKLNQELYFDTYASPEPEDKYNLLARLKELLPVDSYTTYPTIFDLIKEAKIKFQPSNDSTKDNRVLYDIYGILSNENSSFQKQKLELQDLFKRNSSVTKNAKELRTQAYLICTIQAFINGELTLVEFQSALLSIASLGPDENKQKLVNFVDSFRVQAYVDSVDWSEPTFVDFESVSTYQYSDINSRQVIESENPQEFRNLLSQHNVTEVSMVSSSYAILGRAIANITYNIHYTQLMNEFGHKEFSLLLLSIFDKENNYIQAKNFENKFNELQSSSGEFTPTDCAFFDLYQGVQALKTFFENIDSLSHNDVECMLQKLENQRKTKVNTAYFKEVSHFYDVIKSVIYTRRLDDEVLLTNLEKKRNNFQILLENFLDDSGITELSMPIEDDHKSEKNILELNSSYSNYNPKANTIVRDVLKIMVFGSVQQKKDSAYLIENFIDLLNKDSNSKLNDIYKLSGIYREYIQNLLSLESIDNLIVALREPSTKINNELHQVRNSLKNKLIDLQKNINISNIEDVDVQNLKEVVTKQFKMTLAVIHKEAYLEDPKSRALIGEFLGVENAQAKTMDVILSEIESKVEGLLQYKSDLIKIIRDFTQGEIDEKEFYHQLSNYIENHRPRVISKNLAWMYRLFASAENAEKYAMMPSLVEFREAFVNRYIRLEATRADQRPDLICDDKGLVDKINNYIKQMDEQNNLHAEQQEQSAFPIKNQSFQTEMASLQVLADDEKSKHSWLLEGHKRIIGTTLSAAKHSTLFGKSTTLSTEKEIELNLLQQHQTKRLAEELIKENLDKNPAVRPH